MVQFNSGVAAACISATFLFSATSCSQKGTPSQSTSALSTRIDSVSYVLGASIARNMKQQGLEDLNVDAYAKGVRDMMTDDTSMIDLTAGEQLYMAYMTEQQEAKANNNLADAEAFLEENGKKDGVITTESGLQYQIIKEGNGPKPSAEDLVRADYIGTLPDGTVFDSSIERGQPLERKANQLVAGMTEVLQLMSPGANYKVWLHPDLAYGERGAGADIGPNQLIIFDLTLLEIVNEE